jgi:HK97 family phage major capsid protein
MSLLATLKEKRTKRKEILDAAGAILTKADKEGKRALTTEENAEWEKRHKEGDDIKVEISRLERQLDAERELAASPPDERRGGREDVTKDDAGKENRFAKMDKEERAQLRKGALRSYLSGGHVALTPDQREFEAYEASSLNPEQQRALSAATGNVGAYTIPQDFSNQLDVAMLAYGGLLNAIDTTTLATDNGAVLPFPSINDTANSGEAIAENTAATQTVDPAFGVVNFSAYLVDSGIVLVPIALLQDSFWDPEQYLADALGERIGRKKNSLFTTGTGTSQPNGIVTASTLGVTAASASVIAYSEILALIHSVDPAYRPQSSFVMHDQTLLAIKKLVDGNSRPLFLAGGTAEGINGVEPDRIGGYPFVINQAMAQIAASAKIMLFGALKKYKQRSVRGRQMVRFGERFMDKLQIGLMLYERVDANLIDAGTHPVQLYQMHS